MKTLIAFVLLTTAFVCDEKPTSPTVHFTLTIEDHSSTPYQFPEGIYYTFNFPRLDTTINIENTILELIAAGIPVRDVWYKRYSSSCHPPGSVVVLPAVVPPALILRVEQYFPNLIAMNFVEESQPVTGWCAYTVSHYHIT